MASKNLQKSSAIQNNSVTLSSVIIAIIVCNSLYLSTIKLQQFSLITKFSSTYNSSNSRYVTFLAFWIQYKFNSAQKTDLDKERFEHNFFSYLDVLMRQEQGCALENVGFGKQVFHYMFYEYKAIYNIVHTGKYLKAVTDLTERRNEEFNLCYSIFINGVSKGSTYRLNKEVAEACKPDVLSLNRKLLNIQKEILNGERKRYPKYLRDYERQRIKMFDGHRLRLISYFRMSCMVLQYINTSIQKMSVNVISTSMCAYLIFQNINWGYCC